MSAPSNPGRRRPASASSAVADAAHDQERRERRVIHLLSGGLLAGSVTIFGLVFLVAQSLADRPARHADPREALSLDLRRPLTPDPAVPAAPARPSAARHLPGPGVGDPAPRAPVDLQPAWMQTADLGARWPAD